MAELHFTKDHEWVRVEGDIGTVGISNHAQDQLGDIVFVELPSPGRQVSKGDEAAVVESVKAASEVYAPLSGEIVEINEALEGEPQLVNSDPEGAGWFFKIKIANADELAQLMDAATYAAHAAKEG